jgi:hypothetical protein
MIWEEKSYVTSGSLMRTIEGRRRSTWHSSRWRWRHSTCVWWRGRWTMMKNLKKWASSHEDHFPKILFTLSRRRIVEDDGFEYLLFRSQMHVDKRDKVVLAAQQRRRRKPRCVGGSGLFVVTSSVTVAHIYSKDPLRVTTFCNRLGLSLLKSIRYRLVTKINKKRKSWTCEVLDRISADHSRAHQVPACPSPHLARPGEHVCFSFSHLLHTLSSV